MIRTKSNNEIVIHLEGIADYTLCGQDTSGDPYIYDEDPEYCADEITCEHCLLLIRIVKEYLRSSDTVE